MELTYREKNEKSFVFRIFLIEIENVVGYVENKESLNIMNFQYALGRVPPVKENESIDMDNYVKNKNREKKNVGGGNGHGNSDIIICNDNDNNSTNSNYNHNRNDNEKNNNNITDTTNDLSSDKTKIQESSETENNMSTFLFPSISFLDPFNIFSKDSLLNVTQYFPFNIATDTTPTSNNLSSNLRVIDIEEKERKEEKKRNDRRRRVEKRRLKNEKKSYFSRFFNFSFFRWEYLAKFLVKIIVSKIYSIVKERRAVNALESNNNRNKDYSESSECDTTESKGSKRSENKREKNDEKHEEKDEGRDKEEKNIQNEPKRNNHWGISQLFIVDKVVIQNAKIEILNICDISETISLKNFLMTSSDFENNLAIIAENEIMKEKNDNDDNDDNDNDNGDSKKREINFAEQIELELSKGLDEPSSFVDFCTLKSLKNNNYNESVMNRTKKFYVNNNNNNNNNSMSNNKYNDNKYNNIGSTNNDNNCNMNNNNNSNISSLYNDASDIDSDDTNSDTDTDSTTDDNNNNNNSNDSSYNNYNKNTFNNTCNSNKNNRKNNNCNNEIIPKSCLKSRDLKNSNNNENGVKCDNDDQKLSSEKDLIGHHIDTIIIQIWNQIKSDVITLNRSKIIKIGAAFVFMKTKTAFLSPFSGSATPLKKGKIAWNRRRTDSIKTNNNTINNSANNYNNNTSNNNGSATSNKSSDFNYLNMNSDGIDNIITDIFTNAYNNNNSNNNNSINSSTNINTSASNILSNCNISSSQMNDFYAATIGFLAPSLALPPTLPLPLPLSLPLNIPNSNIPKSVFEEETTATNDSNLLNETNKTILDLTEENIIKALECSPLSFDMTHTPAENSVKCSTYSPESSSRIPPDTSADYSPVTMSPPKDSRRRRRFSSSIAKNVPDVLPPRPLFRSNTLIRPPPLRITPFPRPATTTATTTSSTAAILTPTPMERTFLIPGPVERTFLGPLSHIPIPNGVSPKNIFTPSPKDPPTVSAATAATSHTHSGSNMHSNSNMNMYSTLSPSHSPPSSRNVSPPTHTGAHPHTGSHTLSGTHTHGGSVSISKWPFPKTSSSSSSPKGTSLSLFNSTGASLSSAVNNAAGVYMCICMCICKCMLVYMHVYVCLCICVSICV